MLKKISVLILLVFMLSIYASKTSATTIYKNLHTNHDVVAKYESGQEGYKAVAKDSYQGYSYGKWQISTYRKNGALSTFDYFLEYLNDKDMLIYEIFSMAGGYEAAFKGDTKFLEAWVTLAEYPRFQALYDSFLLERQIIPVYMRLDDLNDTKLSQVTTWGSELEPVQAAIESTIIQHGCGGAYRMIVYVTKMYDPQTPKDFVTKLYKRRSKLFPAYKSRYDKECKELTSLL